MGQSHDFAALCRQWEQAHGDVCRLQRDLRAWPEQGHMLDAALEAALKKMNALERRIIAATSQPDDGLFLLKIALLAKRLELAPGEELGPNWDLVERGFALLGSGGGAASAPRTARS